MESQLSALGLAGLEAAVLGALVSLPDSDLDELSALVDRDPGAVEKATRRLVKSGLVVVVPSANGAIPSVEPETRYRAIPPAVALGPLVAERREQLAAAEAEVARLSVIHRSIERRDPSSPVEVVSGRDQVGQRFAQIQLTATHELLGFVPIEKRDPVVPVRNNPAEREAIERGVSFSIVLERAWFEQDDTPALVAEAIAAGQRLYVAERVPFPMVIADASTAMLPIQSGRHDSTPRAAIIHDPGLVAAFIDLFDVHRAAAWPLTGESPTTALPPADDGPDDVDRAVLALMQAGLTDVNIARQVGIAPRSLQRRLQRLMRLADARSRFQLGIHAAQSSWLPDPGHEKRGPTRNPVGPRSTPSVTG